MPEGPYKVPGTTSFAFPDTFTGIGVPMTGLPGPKFGLKEPITAVADAKTPAFLSDFIKRIGLDSSNISNLKVNQKFNAPASIEEVLFFVIIALVLYHFLTNK